MPFPNVVTDLPPLADEHDNRAGAPRSPEQLLAAGCAACFERAIRPVARADRIRVGGLAVTAKVGLGPSGDGRFVLAVEPVAVVS